MPYFARYTHLPTLSAEVCPYACLGHDFVLHEKEANHLFRLQRWTTYRDTIRLQSGEQIQPHRIKYPYITSWYCVMTSIFVLIVYPRLNSSGCGLARINDVCIGMATNGIIHIQADFGVPCALLPSALPGGVAVKRYCPFCF